MTNTETAWKRTFAQKLARMVLGWIAANFLVLALVANRGACRAFLAGSMVILLSGAVYADLTTE